MVSAATQNELTEALCLLPPVQRAFAATLERLRDRVGGLPRTREPVFEIPEPVEFEPLESGRKVPMHVVGWFSGALAVALMISFGLGFATGLAR
jgi:hypothetical protein